jgi:hypothetical protein
MTKKHLDALHKAIRHNTTSSNGDGQDSMHLQGFVSDLLPILKEANPKVKTRLFVKGLVPGPKFERDMVALHGE